ncbi:MAG: DUF3810 family protein [Trueperaceae bacterium]|nr:DUF3810 family protein [Trueperaceae bacterium]
MRGDRPSRLALVGIAAWAGAAAVAWRDGAAEAWAVRVYPGWTQLLVPLSERGAVPWTPLLALVLLGMAWASVRGAGGWIHSVTRLAGLALLVAASFQASWGLHGAASGPATRLLDGAPPYQESADLVQLEERLREVLTATAPSGAFDVAGAADAVRAELAALAPGVRLPARVKHPPRGMLAALGTAGVISPWTLEVHVEPTLPPWSYQSVHAHELAHLAGHDNEALTEFAGLLAGLRAAHPHARYAAALRAWASLPAAVRAPHPGPARAMQDLNAQREHAAAARRDGMARALWWAYDRWLRLRGQPRGIEGYADGVRMLARASRAGAW